MALRKQKGENICYMWKFVKSCPLRSITCVSIKDRAKIYKVRIFSISIWYLAFSLGLLIVWFDLYWNPLYLCRFNVLKSSPKNERNCIHGKQNCDRKFELLTNYAGDEEADTAHIQKRIGNPDRWSYRRAFWPCCRRSVKFRFSMLWTFSTWKSIMFTSHLSIEGCRDERGWRSELEWKILKNSTVYCFWD